MNELEINRKVGFEIENGVVISAPWDIYFKEREYSWTEEGGESSDSEVFDDFDLDTPAPEGYQYYMVMNLRGGKVNFKYVDLEDNDQEMEVTENFAVYVKDDQELGTIYKTSFGVDYFDLFSEPDDFTKEGYDLNLASLNTPEIVNEISVYTLVWEEQEAGNFVRVIGTYVGPGEFNNYTWKVGTEFNPESEGCNIVYRVQVDENTTSEGEANFILQEAFGNYFAHLNISGRNTIEIRLNKLGEGQYRVTNVLEVMD